MILVFNQERIPRSTTRAEWREIDRWRRVMQKKLSALEAQLWRTAGEMASMRDALGAHDPLAARLNSAACDVRDRLINPPAIIYPPLDRATLAADRDQKGPAETGG